MTYDYQCEKCNAQFEEIHPIADRDLPADRPCPQCAAHSVTRGITAPFFSYEGGKTLEQRARGGAGSDFVDIMKSIRKRHPGKAKDGTKQTVHY